MNLDPDLKASIDSLKWKINTFLGIAILLAVISVGTFIFYAYFPGKVYNWFPANPHDYANNLSVVLASLSGVLFVYIAFLGQRWQMLYQQQEIRDNREEMKKSNAELKIQAEALTNQISRMDRDFIHQNFFRILEQHFSTRDRLSYPNIEDKDMNPDILKLGLTNYSGEKSFLGMIWHLLYWIDDRKNGWFREMKGVESDQFYKIYGFRWIDRGTKYDLSNLSVLKFLSRPEDFEGLNTVQIQFIFRVILSEGHFDSYLRSNFYLLNYIKTHNLTQYFIAIEAGMGNHERIFMFYFLTTQMDLHNQTELKEWLMENNFLFSVKEEELLDPEHKSLLYPKDGYLPTAYIKT